MTFWHPYAGICFLQRTGIFLQTKNCFHRCTCTTNCKHQWYVQRDLTSETTERFTILYRLCEHLLASWERERCHAELETRSSASARLYCVTALGYACTNRLERLAGQRGLFTESSVTPAARNRKRVGAHDLDSK